MPKPLLPFTDYQRIYQVIYSVLEASASARTHRACLFFATAGMLILRKHYKLEATFSAGSMALMVDEETASVVVYGRLENDEWVYDANGFHAWVECEGWLIDFMAPIMGNALKEDGHAARIPRNMLQMQLEKAKPSPSAIQHVGEFFCHHDSAIAETILDSQPAAFFDLLKVCEAWYQRPPKKVPQFAMGASDFGRPIPLQLRAPAIEGSW